MLERNIAVELVRNTSFHKSTYVNRNDFDPINFSDFFKYLWNIGKPEKNTEKRHK